MAPKPQALLFALGALTLSTGLGSSLVLAQVAPATEPAPAAAPSQATTPPGETLSGQAYPGTGAAKPHHPSAGSFDASLDQLVREGIVTPQERLRVHTNLLGPRTPQQREACRSGALSQLECDQGTVLRGRLRPDANLETPGLAGGAGLGPGFRTDAQSLPPISVPVTALLAGAAGSFRLTDVFARTPRPAPIAGNGNASLLFPLIGSAITSSGFGWRLHPLLGAWLMHAGRDLAAPEGTPVVAALSGQVVSSGLAGGYGLAVEIEHTNPRRRTLYGHLSELFVRGGQNVRQGEVIGRVGSTGLSTGPHLHFELRLPQEGGWVAVDPGQLDPGGLFASPAGGRPGARATDAVALLMGQLIASLERPIRPLAPATGSAGHLPPPSPRPRPAALPAPARHQG